MAVIRTANGGLLAWSPVGLTAGLRDELAALGEVRLLVAPNSLHHLHLAEWREAFPEAALHAAPGLARKRPDLACEAELDDVPLTADLDQVVVRGNAITTEVVFFHRPSGTVLFTDLLQQFPPGWFRGWRAIVARLDLMTQPQAAVPRKFRLAFTDRRAAREAVHRILAWPAQKVVMAHGTPVERDPRTYLSQAFRWLTG
jgi:phage tail protein X